ncbi:TetR/AcrR family transcriptional regulator [Actinoplanes palleronii]|uniref:TetR family transcriptional regulator n=1 Tax=Actinoplanes palleronii TaxID=113570 RepID=A0ABQ4BIM4_9ACTN|nr:TetR/AcrR family transcriptional regulator [Actinoplanes palleronii]GIE70537.1 TetR family transcriptional regulator [Actinoplanes palleronii]
MVAEPVLRADARRNLNLIIATARELFAESGLDVPMEAIARRAGVGVGTLYRRFPDRGELVAAVAAYTFRAVLVDLRAATDATASAWDAFVRLLTGSENLLLTISLAFLSPQAWTAVHAAPESRDVHREMMTALDRLVSDAQREGAIRADVGAGDVLSLVSLVLGSQPSAAGSAERVRHQRWLWLVLDGLRARPGSPLPGTAVTLGDLNLDVVDN